MGKHQLRLLKFALRFYYGPDNWHSLGTDPYTRRAAHDLAGKGLLRFNDKGQFQANVGHPGTDNPYQGE